jgi:hypothetical protein
MLKRCIAVAFAIAVALGGAGVASADPDPNGPAKFGLCKAYGSGSGKGQEKKHEAGPFQALEEAADDANDDTSPAEDVAAFCADAVPGG